MRMNLAEFLVCDFERLGEPLLQRCAALDGHRLYITGATGFFGKSLLALLALLYQRGIRFEVTALSRNPARFLVEQPWCAQQPWLHLYAGDIRQPWPTNGPYSLLLHAATDTAASAHRDKQTVFDDVLAGAQQMVKFCAANGVQRLLLTGSGAQFGAIPCDFANTGVPDEVAFACDPTQASSAYGEGKRITELLAALHAQSYPTAIINTRCFAFVGPGLPLAGHFAIGNFIRDAILHRPIILQSAGQAMRSYLYSADLAMWLLLLLLEAPAGSRINIGSEAALSILELAQRVSAVLQPGLPVRVGIERLGEERSFYVPSTKAAAQLGLFAWTSLETAIRRTAHWHLNHEL